MANQLRDDLATYDETSLSYIFEQNVTISLRSFPGLVRCNIYRPKRNAKVPVLVSYCPYGKDIHYKESVALLQRRNSVSYQNLEILQFPPQVVCQLNPDHQSEHSAFELPEPEFWTAHGYAIVRSDEVGLGQSPGVLDSHCPASISV
jgi:predicted acyl esterase